ncbi:hypothetical protein ACLOJK_006802 [Asimina triloba]
MLGQNEATGLDGLDLLNCTARALSRSIFPAPPQRTKLKAEFSPQYRKDQSFGSEIQKVVERKEARINGWDGSDLEQELKRLTLWIVDELLSVERHAGIVGLGKEESWHSRRERERGREEMGGKNPTRRKKTLTK